MPVPFVIYAGFKAIKEKVQGSQPNIDKSYTETYQKHKDCVHGYKVICCYDNKYTKPVQIYRGENAVYKFMEKMLEEVQWCRKMTKKHFHKPVRMTKKDQQDFEEADNCHICNKRYSEKDIRVGDHCSMSQYLLTGDFRWLTEKELNKIDLAKYTEDSKSGLILEVNLEYPHSLHDLHNDYPLVPEKISVSKYVLSNYCETIRQKYNITIGQVKKLIPTLSNREKYVLHYRNLQLYLDFGLKFKKVQRVLESDQSPWLKQYGDFNTQKRTK